MRETISESILQRRAITRDLFFLGITVARMCGKTARNVSPLRGRDSRFIATREMYHEHTQGARRLVTRGYRARRRISQTSLVDVDRAVDVLRYLHGILGRSDTLAIINAN